jgi:hypothetical protein
MNLQGDIVAWPSSVNVLDNGSLVGKDSRLPQQLLMSNDSQSRGASKRCWLAPVAATLTEAEMSAGYPPTGSGHKLVLPMENQLLIAFAHPMIIAAIRLFNYSRSWQRGVKSFSVELDEHVIYMGELLPAHE